MALSDITFHQVGMRLFTDALNANFLREEKTLHNGIITIDVLEL